MQYIYFALSKIEPHGLPKATPDVATTHELLSIVFAIIGAIALLIVTLSGFRYVLSAGDPQKTANAKNTLIYALVGLAIAISAEAIIAFVVNRV